MARPKSSQKGIRKRSNFMIKVSLLEEMESLVPKGQWSDFVNDAMEKELTRWGRQKASELMDEFNKNHPGPAVSDEEIIKEIKNARRY